MMIIDSHQHFWHPDEINLPPIPPEAAVLDRAYLPDDLQPQIAKAGVTHTILVQGYPQDLATNSWYFKHANAHRYIAGVVAWIDLQNPRDAGGALDTLQAEPKFVGIRHIVEEEPDVDFIVQPPAIETFAELARRDIPYDMLARTQHFDNVLTVLEKVPGLRMVLDHLGKPAIAKGGTSGWEEGLRQLAQHRQVYCKLSGMITEAKWDSWTAADLSPYVHKVVEIFGPDRVMFGSDWPVCRLAGTYEQVWEAFNQVLPDLNDQQRAGVLGENARSFYRLQLNAEPM